MSKNSLSARVVRGWEIVKSSWSVISTTKSLLFIVAAGFIANALLLAGLVIFGLRAEFSGSLYSFGFYPQFDILALLSIFVYYCAANIINVFLAGVVSHNVLARFAGQPASLRSSIKTAWIKKQSLFAFSIMSSLVGYLLAAIAEKVPFVSNVLAWFGEATWAAATFFAVPIIMQRQEKIAPRDVTMQSSKVLKALWKEGITSQLSIGFIFLLAVITAYILLVVVTRIAYVTVGIDTAAAMIIMAGAGLGLIAIILVFNLIGLIARCALYRYQTTGDEPVGYSLSVLRAGMTISKARKIF